MDAVTYSNDQVQAELEHWLFRKIDVTEHEAMAATLGVKAVPIAIAITGDGRSLERIPNFVEPELFARTLKNARTSP